MEATGCRAKCPSNHLGRPRKSFIRLLLPFFTLTAAVVVGFTPASFAAPTGVGLGIAPTYPALVQVGQVNLNVSVTITNTSTPPEDGGTVTLSDIFHTPSCGSTETGDPATGQCQSGHFDPGVFIAHGPISGTDGSTSCTAATWTIGSPDPVTGEVALIPSISVVLDSPATPGDHCTISFQVDVVGVPTMDASALQGTQTAQLGRAKGVASVGGTVGTGTGSSLTTVVEATPTPTETPTNTPTPTFTPTETPTNTPTPTETPTNTPTNSPTPTFTPTETPTNTPTPTFTPTNTPTNTPTETPTNTPTPTFTSTSTPTNTPTETPTNTPSPSFTATERLIPPVPVVSSPTSPAGLLLLSGLGLSIAWMLRRAARAQRH